MIAKLWGCLDSVIDQTVLLNVQGVGYQLSCSRKTIDALPDKGADVALCAEMIVRQDLIQLYGFYTEAEKQCFKVLLSVQGVGMKAALAILSVLSPEDLARAISAQDKAWIATADGVGPKLAARVVNELKDKVSSLPVTLADVSTLPSSAPNMTSYHEEAVSALIQLGYRRQEAVKAVTSINDAGSIEEMIRMGLANLSRAS
ncbi:MAG: Holliday junction branch migration protein RuvA [Alphaproteobacteria bacterium]